MTKCKAIRGMTSSITSSIAIAYKTSNLRVTGLNLVGVDGQIMDLCSYVTQRG